ncbi:MAG: hypothetical protein U0R71_16875 [Solirubrobacterales bacterium]
MRLSLSQRRSAVGLLSSLLALAIGIAAGLLLLASSGVSVGDAVQALYEGAFGSWGQTAATLARAVPLAGVALAWMVAARGGLFNVGLDGQIVIGGIAAAAVALLIGLPSGVHLLAATVAGVIGGLAWAGIATLLRTTRGVNEIISTLMLNFVALQLLSWAVRGPLQGSQGLPQTDSIPTSAAWPSLEARAGLNWEIVLIVVLAVAVAVLLGRTAFGFRLRFTAANERAARAGGIRTTRVGALAMLISGGIGGLVGAGLILGGQSKVMTDGFNGTYGYDGIAVALIARTSVPAALLAAILFAALRQGGDLLEATTGAPAALIEVMQGLIIVLVAASTLLTDRMAARRVDAPDPAPRSTAPSVQEA